jgi:probable rRNA maturation factor
LGIDGDVNLLLVRDREIKKINKRYLNHDYATDVIAFEMKEHGVFGDVVVSTETARRQARDQGHSVLTETTLLAVHGILHLLGYRDKTRKDRDRMWRKTNALMKRVN